MSDFTAKIQAILDTTKIPSQIAAIEKTSLTLRKINLDTKNLPSQIQASLDGHSFTIKLDGIKMANINSQATKAGQTYSQAFADGVRTQLSNGGIEASIARVTAQYEKLATSGHGYLSKITTDIQQLNDLHNALATNTGDDAALVATYREFSEVLTLVRNNLITVSSQTKSLASKSQIDEFGNKMSTWMLNNTKASGQFGASIADIRRRLSALGDNVPISELNALEEEFKQIKLQASAAGLAGDSFATTVKKSFKNISSYISIATILRQSTEVLKEMATNVLAVDTAMTGLYRVTNLTDAEYKQLYKSMAKSAKDYGAELNAIIDSTTNWTKLGFEVNIAKQLAEVTTMYQQVADLDTKTAVNNLVTAYKGFEDQLLALTGGDTVAAVELVADIFNKLGNEFAVEASDIGAALNNSASALVIAGNTIQQTAGMATGIIEVTQDASRAGNALRTLSMRLRGTTAEELQALGEDADGLIEVTSKLQATVKKQTGVDLVDANGQLRSTFEIMRDLAGVWDDLDTNTQASVLETIAGKNRASDIAALLNNWDQVEEAVNAATNAAGTARAEYDIFLESLQAHLNRLETAWQKLSYSFMDVGLLKGGVDILVGALEALDAIVNTLGSAGTIGAGIGLFALFKNVEGIKTFINVINAARVGTIQFGGALNYTKVSLASFIKTPLGVATAIGLITAAVSAAVQAYRNWKAEQEVIRKQTIETSNGFLDSVDAFEKAYIKYAGQTNLTKDEESELRTAIDGTASALDNKNDNLLTVIGTQEKYIENLDTIADAEIEAASRAAKAAQDSAKDQLLDDAWSGWTGSNITIDLSGRSGIEEFVKAREILEESMPEYIDEGTWGKELEPIDFDKNKKDASAIVDYYYKLIEARDKMIDAGLMDNDIYDGIVKTIDHLSGSVSDYIEQTYNVHKYNYMLSNGIPTTTEEYKNMCDAIVGATGASGDFLTAIQNLAEQEFGWAFGDIFTPPDDSDEAVYLTFPELIRDTDSVNDDIDHILKQIEDVKYLQDMLEKLREGKFTPEDQLDLIMAYPELANSEDLEQGIIGVIGTLRGASAEVGKEASGIIAILDSMYESLDPEDADGIAAFNKLKEVVLSIFDTTEEGIPVFSSISDAIKGVSDASDLLATAQEEMAENGEITLGTLQKLAQEFGGDIGKYITIDSSGKITANIDAIKAYYTQAIKDMALEDKALETSLVNALSGGFDTAESGFEKLTKAMAEAQDVASIAASAQEEFGFDTVESLRKIFGENFEQYIVKDSAGNYIGANTEALREYARTMLETSGASGAMLAEFDEMWTSTINGSKKATTALDRMSDALENVSSVSDYLTFVESEDLSFIEALEKAVKLLEVMGDGYSLSDFFSFKDGKVTYNTQFLSTWIDSYIDGMVTAGDITADFATQMKAAAKAEAEQVNAIEQLTDAMSKVEKASDLIATAQEEMAKSGKNSIQTIISLYEQFGDKASTMFSTTSDGGFIIDTDLVKQEMYALIDTIDAASPEIKQAMKDALDVELEDDAFKKVVDEHVGRIKTLQEALSTLRKDGKLSDSALYDLVMEFPELATKTGNLEDAIISLIGTMNTNIVSEFGNQFGKIDSKEDREQLQAFMDIVLKLGEVVGNTQFAIDINAETEGMQDLFDAMKESVSSTGLTAESLTNLKQRYKDLESYDPARLFERTEHGIHLNTKALRELEKEYETLTKESIDNALDDLIEQYNDLTKQIDSAGTAASTVDLYSQRNDILKQIEETAELAAQYAGLTSNFYKWEQAQSIGEEGDMYDSLTGGLEDIAELYKEGLIGTNKFRAAVQLMTDEDLSGATGDELLAIYKTGYPLMKRYFQDSSDGVLHFLHDAQKVNSEWVHMNKDGSWEINFGVGNDEEIAKALGISTEAVQLIMRKLSDYGFDINLDSMYTTLDTMQTKAETAAKKLKELGITDVDFNFNATNIERIDEQIEDATEALNKFQNADGSINLEMEGAAEAQYVLATLILQKQGLETPLLLKVDANNIEGVVGETLRKLQTIKQNYNNLQLQAAIGADTSGIQASIDATIGSFTAEEIEILGTLGIDPTASTETINAAIAAVTPEMLVTVGVDETALTTFGETSHDTTATVVYNVDGSAVAKYQPGTKYGTVKYTATLNAWTPPDKYGTVYYTAKTSSSSSSSGNKVTNALKNVLSSVRNAATGTAYAGGTSGNWGTKDSGVALGGELGEELVVRNGKFFTIGADSAEFFKYKKGDIIFNADQTEEIFNKGKITNAAPRGKALAQGTAFSSGSGTITVGGHVITKPSGGKGSGSGSSKDDDSDSKIIDWIEIAIDRIERAINGLGRIAQSAYKTLAKRLGAGDDEIRKVQEEINVQSQGYNRYMQEAESIGLSSSLKERVRNGTIDINEYDGDTADLIEDYQSWYEKALDCADAVDELHETLASLYEEKFDNISTDFENQISMIEHRAEMFNTNLDEIEARGYLGGSELYSGLISAENDKISKLNSELVALTNAMNAAVNSGEIDIGSEAWYSMQATINETKLAIQESELAVAEFNNAMRELDWSHFDFLQERISQITKETDFLINLMSDEDLYTDKGQLTDIGIATMGMHGANYNTYLAQAQQYAKEIRELERDLAKDPYNSDLIERREELIALQQDSIAASEAEKQAIVDMVQEGINLELSSLKELIDAYTDSLDSAKDLYDYQKKVKKQTAEVASLQKQLAAYQGDTSEENRARLQKLQIDLSDAMEDLEETQYDRYVKEQKQLLDDFYTDYEEILNQRLDNIDALISDMIDMVNANSDIIADTIVNEASEVGYALSESMRSIWMSGGSANSVITTFEHTFSDKLTTLNAVISGIAGDVAAIVSAGDGIAEDTVRQISGSRSVQGYSGGGYVAELQKIAMRNGDDIVTMNTLKQGEAVLTPEQTEALKMYANRNLTVPLDVSHAPKAMSQIIGHPVVASDSEQYGAKYDVQNTINIEIDHVENYDDLVYKMKRDKGFERFIQSMTTDRLVGGSRLAKYKVGLGN